MASATINKARVIENSGAVLLARVVKDSGAAIVQADITSITAKVFSADDGTQISTPTLTVAGCVYDTLQTDARWSADSIGYNVAISLSGDNWPDAGNYRIEIKFTPASGNPFYVVWDVLALNIFSE